MAKGKGLLDVCMLEEAGGINLCCFPRPFQFSKYFVLFLSSSPPPPALTGKEKTWDNLLGKPYFEVASESLNTGRAENHAEKNPSLLLHPLFY